MMCHRASVQSGCPILEKRGAALALTDSSMVKDAFVCVIRCKYSNYFWKLG